MEQLKYGTFVAYDPGKGKDSVVITTVTKRRITEKSYSSAEEALAAERRKALGQAVSGLLLKFAGEVSASVIMGWGTIAACLLANADAGPDVRLLAFPGASEVGNAIADTGSRLYRAGDKKLEQLNIIESGMQRNISAGQRTR